ncbi:4-hydroxy-tetrahydrodipicolinate reductase [Litorimonas sp.]|uniref:4-hydroxy-tetrahydrodipicolinate reductase n=1 Tax=Litorimonas sp. TaxID=1892381 RepID=UPI003A89C240
MTDLLKVSVLGADGRMGRAVISALSETEGVKLVAALTHSESADLGKDSVALADAKGEPVILTDDMTAARKSDVIIDFSAPKASLTAAEAIKNSGVRAIISGTTGMSAAQSEAFHKTCEGIVLLQSGNFSLGVNMLEALVELGANKLREGWDIDVLEMHHRHKVDAPSGTALMLGRAAAKGRNVELETVQKLSREGQTGARPEGEIGFATLRGGGVIGEHAVKIASELEMLTLSHSAFDRSVFAKGAVSAAIWAAKQAAGRYDMKDMLGL